MKKDVFLLFDTACIYEIVCLMNITVRQSRQSGVARATCPD